MMGGYADTATPKCQFFCEVARALAHAMPLDEDRAVLLSNGVTMEQLAMCDAATIRAFAARVPENTCCFCQETFGGWGHSPSPVLEDVEALACGACDVTIVLPQRLRNNAASATQ